MTQCFSVAHRSVTHPGPPRYKGHNQWSFGKTDGKPLADRRAGRRQEGGAGRLGGVEEGGWVGWGNGSLRCCDSLVNAAHFLETTWSERAAKGWAAPVQSSVYLYCIHSNVYNFQGGPSPSLFITAKNKTF